MSNEPQQIVIKQSPSLFSALGWVLFFGMLYFGWNALKVQDNVNQVPIVVNESMTRMAATPTGYSAPVVEPTQQPDYQATINAIQEAPTATLAPTQTAVPLIQDYGLPNVGPYSLDQVRQCQDIKASSGLNMLPSPQLELCQMYTRGG